MRTPRATVLLPVCLAVACAGVLGLRTSPAHLFEHRAHVLAGIACVRCHQQVARPAQASASPATLDLPATSTCVACHQKPHDTGTCIDCHGLAQNRQALTEAKLHLRFDHASHNATGGGQCVRCHTNIADPAVPLRPGMASCLGCHEHRQEWDSRRCDGCHRNMEAEQTRPLSHVMHGDEFLRGHGAQAAVARDLCSSCHAESMCTSCHGVNVPALPSLLRFDDPHRADMHAAGFFARHGIEAGMNGALCTTCHTQASCGDCHRQQGVLPNAASPGRSPHPAGWVGTTAGMSRHGIEARQNPVLCASCHGGSGEALCVGCHRVGGPGGNPHPSAFVSSKPISELPCRLCHTEAP